MRKLAFTLTEILITLTIVGVVAVLTVPNISKNIYTKSDIATLQSTLKNITDSVKTMMIDERVTRISDSSLYISTMNNFFDKYLKVIQVCNILDPSNCFAEEYKSISGKTYPLEQDVSYAFQVTDISPIATLPSGASIIFGDNEQLFVRANDNFKDVDGNSVNVFLVDVNGPKPPNVIGVDFFAFQMDDRGHVGYFKRIPDQDLVWNSVRKSCREGNDYGISCAYVLQANNWDVSEIINKYPDQGIGKVQENVINDL